MGFLKRAIAQTIKTVMHYKELEFKVAGVTFKNGRKNRQTILKHMKQGKAPFDNGCKITFERYDFEGELAISVLANGEQIGNVPRKLIAEFDEYWVSDYIVESWTVTGSEPYGCTIKVLFNNK